MKRFAALYAALDDTRATSAKLEAMRAYFAEAPAEDAAWALYFLSGQRLKRLIAPTLLRAWVGEATGLAPVIVEECYAHVGDLAETLALLLDRAGRRTRSERGLADWVDWLLALREQSPEQQRAALFAAWAELPRAECFLLNKLLTGALRVGVSSGLAARALALHAGLDETLVAQRLMGDWQPSAEAFAALIAPGGGERHPSQPYPFCLASPLEDAPDASWQDGLPSGLGAVTDFLAEWKWDGIRGQLIRRGGQTYLWSRGEELLSGRFPEIEAAAAHLPEGCVLDGEILAHDGAQVLPFAVLQTRIARKTVGRKLLADAPVAFFAYDLLEADHEDLRTQPLAVRRKHLEDVVSACAQPRLRLSEPVIAADWAALAERRREARARGVEGLMLKRLDSAYQAGRRRGAWWKWKLEAMTIDCVLLYAQAGHGRRANLYTDYTLGVWAKKPRVASTARSGFERPAKDGGAGGGQEGRDLARDGMSISADEDSTARSGFERQDIDVRAGGEQEGHDLSGNDMSSPAEDDFELVPVAKAYSGLTDAELTAMDAWIKKHTREKFGPVRSVDPVQVFEIAFEGIQASPRHKAGVALRFPRIARWRRDKPAAEANTLEDLQALLRR